MMNNNRSIDAVSNALAFNTATTLMNVGELRNRFIRESAHYLGIELSESFFEALEQEERVRD